MVKLEIPCTRFSKRILKAEYGKEPIKVGKRHPLFWKIRPPASGFTLPPPLVPLDAAFTIECSTALAQQLTRYLNDAGVTLYRSHIDNMIQFAWARSLAGVPPLSSLKLFYEMYGILETDLDVMSAHKAWQRWKKENEDSCIKSRNFYPVVVPNNSCPSEGFEFPLPEREVQEKVDEVKNALYERRPDTPAYIFRQVSIWLHFKKGAMPMPDIAKKHRLSLSRAYHAVQKIDGYLTYDKELAALMGTTPAAAAAPTFA